MKNLILIFSLITCFGYSQDNAINEIFFDIPLNESRNSIYNYCLDSGLFIKKESKSKLTRKGKEIKIFSGRLKKLSSELIKGEIDSVGIQLSSGNVSIEGERKTKKLLVFWSYYYTSDIKSAKRKYKKLKKRISKISKEKPFHFENFEIEENDDYKKQIGYSDNWYFSNEVNLEIELKFEILEENKKYLIQIGYSRYE